MSDIRIEKTLNMSREEAREAGKAWLASAEKKFGLTGQFTAGDSQDTITFKRSGLDGKGTLDGNKLLVTAKIGMLMRPMKGMIQEQIESGLDKYFH